MPSIIYSDSQLVSPLANASWQQNLTVNNCRFSASICY